MDSADRTDGFDFGGGLAAFNTASNIVRWSSENLHSNKSAIYVGKKHNALAQRTP